SSRPPPPPTSTLFPYTTLFRSALHEGHGPVPDVRLLRPCHPDPEGGRSDRHQDLQCAGRRGSASGHQGLRQLAHHPAALHQWRRSEEHTSELQSLAYLVCRLLL